MDAGSFNPHVGLTISNKSQKSIPSTCSPCQVFFPFYLIIIIIIIIFFFSFRFVSFFFFLSIAHLTLSNFLPLPSPLFLFHSPGSSL